jgi:hypothetical protein
LASHFQPLEEIPGKKGSDKMKAKWFYDVEVVTNGAVSSHQTFTSDCFDGETDPMAEFIADVEHFTSGSSKPTEVFVQFHEHEPFSDGEDVCGQFETDGHPTYSWNMENDVSKVPQKVHVVDWTGEDFPHGEEWSPGFAPYVFRWTFDDDADVGFPWFPPSMTFRWDRRHD